MLGAHTVKSITPLVQQNMKITNTDNPDIIKGIKHGNAKYYTETSSNNFVHIDLQDEYFVKGIKLCFYHYDNRFYTYECWVSKDNQNWKELFSDFDAKCNDTIIIMDSIRYIRLKGKNNVNEFIHITDFKIF